MSGYDILGIVVACLMLASLVFIVWRKHKKNADDRLKDFWLIELEKWTKKAEEAEEEERTTELLSLPGIDVSHIYTSPGDPTDPEVWSYFSERGTAWEYLKTAPHPQKQEFETLLERWYSAKFRARVIRMKNQVVLQAFWDMHHKDPSC